MGELYLATELGASAGTPPCVVKVLLPEYSGAAEFVSMFHDEARIGMQLRHSNIVGVYDLGRIADTPYLTLEYVHGENLRSILYSLNERGERLPVEHAVYVVIEALQGLSYAHEKKDVRGRPLNLVHRDLSPDNVMVTFDGDVKILDFGIAKAEGRATQTQFGILKGKVHYMSPEQALGIEVDARADVYAMGLVLLEILIGERRFEKMHDVVQMIRDARTWTPEPPSKHDPSIPAELDPIILKSLQSASDRRFQSAGELASALGRLHRSGSVPRPRESLPALMRRLFPDRAEPFLQVDPSRRQVQGRNADSTRDPALDDPIPDEQELLGAFLSRGSHTSRGGDGPTETVVAVARAMPPPHAGTQEDTTQVAAQALRGELDPPTREPAEATMESTLGDAPVTGTRIAATEDTAPEVFEGTVVRRHDARSRDASRDKIPAARAKAQRQPSRETTNEPAVPQTRSGRRGAGRAITFSVLLIAGASALTMMAFPEQMPAGLRERLAALFGGGTEPSAPLDLVPEAAAPVAVATPEEQNPTELGSEDDTGPAVGGGRFPGEVRAVETPRRGPAASRLSSRAPAKKSTNERATVRVVSAPAGFEIRVDGVGTGKKTPATVAVEPGLRVVSIEAEGYAPWSFRETLRAGDTLSLTADLQRRRP